MDMLYWLEVFGFICELLVDMFWKVLILFKKFGKELVKIVCEDLLIWSLNSSRSYMLNC